MATKKKNSDNSAVQRVGEYSLYMGSGSKVNYEEAEKELKSKKQLALTIAEHIDKGGKLDIVHRLYISQFLKDYAELLPEKMKKSPGTKSEHDYGLMAFNVALIMVKEKKAFDPACFDYLGNLGDKKKPTMTALKKGLKGRHHKNDEFSRIDSALHFARKELVKSDK